LTQKEEQGLGENREKETSLAGMSTLSPISIWEQDSSDEKSEGEYEKTIPEEVELAPHIDAPF
jgi:hypothetical protein